MVYNRYEKKGQEIDLEGDDEEEKDCEEV